MSFTVTDDNSTFCDIVFLSTLHCCQLIEPKYLVSRICFSRRGETDIYIGMYVHNISTLLVGPAFPLVLA